MNNICRIVNCKKSRMHQRTLCTTHFKRWSTYKSFDLPIRKKKGETRILKICKNCNNQFHPTLSNVNRGKGIFCGNSCSTSYRNKNNKKNTHDIFLSNIIKDENNCWNYQVGQSYGRIVLSRNKEIKAHRYSYIFYKGKIPKDRIICHKCDNKRCVNPDHLYAGTSKDNAADRENRSIINRKDGELHYNASLTEEQVIEIKKKLANGIQNKIIAKEYNVGVFCISAIKTGKTWKKIKAI